MGWKCRSVAFLRLCLSIAYSFFSAFFSPPPPLSCIASGYQKSVVSSITIISVVCDITVMLSFLLSSFFYSVFVCCHKKIFGIDRMGNRSGTRKFFWFYFFTKFGKRGFLHQIYCSAFVVYLIFLVIGYSEVVYQRLKIIFFPLNFFYLLAGRV